VSSDFTRSHLEQMLGFGLTSEQWDAVGAPMEPAVIVAGAGSGKTTSMEARVAWLVGTGQVMPDAVLGLTFTNKATAQLAHALTDRVATMRTKGLIDHEEVAADPTVSTYHSFAAQILTDHGIRLGREPYTTLLADGARQQLAYQLVCSTDLPLNQISASAVSVTKSLLSLDDQLAELDLQPGQVIAHEQELAEWLSEIPNPQSATLKLLTTGAKRILLCELVSQWRAVKASRDVEDFSDQVRLALELVRRFPEVGQSLRDQFHVVLLDEYQDTSIAQRKLLQEIFTNGHAVTAVGDPCQAIYGWRGASVHNIESFPQHFSQADHAPATRLTLSANRRSGSRILQLANAVSDPLRAEHAGVLPLTAGAGRGDGHLRAGLFTTIGEETQLIAQQVQALGHAGVALSEIAVLAGNTAVLAAVDRQLRAIGVPTQVAGAAVLFAQPVIVDLHAILQVLHDPTANAAFVRLATGPRWAIGMRDMVALGRHGFALSGQGGRAADGDLEQALQAAVAGMDVVELVSLAEAADDADNAPGVSDAARARLAELSAEIRALRRYAGEPLAELIGRILHVTGLEVEASLGDEAMVEQQQFALSTFMRLAADFVGIDGSMSLGAFLVRLADIERFDIEPKVDVPARPQAVQLMTVFAAKGLEFEHVFVAAVVDTAFPFAKARETWMGAAHVVPWHLREDRTPDLISYPDREDVPTASAFKAYTNQVLAAQNAMDVRRLAYVAFTRAKDTLTVTGHWWGPTQSTRRGPHEYLLAVKAACDEAGVDIQHWADPPESGQPNPNLSELRAPWPIELDSSRRAALVRARDLVEAHALTAGTAGAEDGFGLSTSQRDHVATWDRHLQVALAEMRERSVTQRIVRAPEVLSASALIRAVDDPHEYALDLLRPMPTRPAAAARRGTALHSWIEARYGQQSLLDPDDLPGASDADLLTDADLEAMKSAFEDGPYATATPVAIEAPFALMVAGRVIRGRIDAVFADGDRFQVVDWKTGSAASNHPLQLSIYRAAWAQLAGVDPDRVDAVFYMVSSKQIIRPVLPALPGDADMADPAVSSRER